MTEVLKTQFPTKEDAKSQMPEGREPYHIVWRALTQNVNAYAYSIGEGFPYGVAIAALADEVDNLIPPLPPDLKDLVLAANTFVERFTDDPSRVIAVKEDFNPLVASHILSAVFEHGYGAVDI